VSDLAILLNEDYSAAEKLLAEPICGEDFCDKCGDCLHCYGDDEWCQHTWYVYADEVAEWKAAHPEAKPRGIGAA
jgi:hypothetical protein